MNYENPLGYGIKAKLVSVFHQQAQAGKPGLQEIYDLVEHALRKVNFLAYHIVSKPEKPNSISGAFHQRWPAGSLYPR